MSIRHGWHYSHKYHATFTTSLQHKLPLTNILRDHPTKQGTRGRSLEVQPELPDVTDWKWETSQTAGYIPKWTTLHIAEIAYLERMSCKCAQSCKGNCICFKQTWNAHHFANVVGPAISRRLELRYVDRYLGMLNYTEKDRQCSRHREIEYGCHLNEMERYKLSQWQLTR